MLLVSSRSATVEPFPAFSGRVKHETFGRLTNAILNGPLVRLGFNLRRVFSWFWFEMQILRSFREIRRWKPDVIVVSSLSLLTFLTGTILKKYLRVPLVVEVRDVYPLTLIEVGGFSRWHPGVIFLGWIEKLGYRNADAITSSLPNLGPHIEDRIGQKKPVTYLPMGYSQEFFEDLTPSAKAVDSLRKIGQFKGTFSVGYCGNIGLANALVEPLEAFFSLADELPDAHFWIVGDGPMRSKYESEFGSAPNIHFLGRHPKSDMPHLLDTFDIVINPWIDKPIYRFGVSPNKWIDYMFAAKPILVPYNGHPFLIEDEEIGWFIPPQNREAFRDAIVDLYKLSRDELEGKGLNGKRYLEQQLSYDLLASRLHNLLKRLVKSEPIESGGRENISTTPK